MGIRGLTTFIYNRSHLYLEEHELHDCNVILDGNSIASNLYKWHCKSNDCFGGDYDKYANVVYNFFTLLSQCNIVPYIIFDGGYEQRKVKTVLTRMKNKIHAANAMNPITEGSISVFPLFLRDVFLDVVNELGIKKARCDLEGDMEIAGIAKVLECPVISFDSDFYIFGCLYVPFSTVDLTVRKKCDDANQSFTYLSCKIYRIETFLLSYGGLDKSNLPILAVLLGNDYVKGSLFNPFFNNIKIQKINGKQPVQQKRIKSLIVWLQTENIRSAIKKVLKCFKKDRRLYIANKMADAMRGYFVINSELLNHLGIKEPYRIEAFSIKVELQNILEELDNDGEENVENSDNDQSSIEEEKSEGEEEQQQNFIINKKLDVFHENFRNCQYPSCFMDILRQNRYYCIPQVEDRDSDCSHSISFDILSVIGRILRYYKQGKVTLALRFRRSKDIQFIKLYNRNIKVFDLNHIRTMDLETRQQFFLQVLQIDEKFSEKLTQLPKEFHLFLMAMKYMTKIEILDRSLIVAVVLCFYVLNYVDSKIGFYRASKVFGKKFSAFSRKNNNKFDNQKDTTGFVDLTYDSCMLFMNKVVAYFQMDVKLKTNYKLFDRSLVHSMAQIQSTFLHTKYLNALLNYPFPNFIIHRIFDGTFIYNMSKNFQRRSDIISYLDALLLNDCPDILRNLKYVFSVIENLFNLEQTTRVIKKRRKRKNKKIVKEDAVKNEEKMESKEDSDNEVMLDPNNFYSILSTL